VSGNDIIALAATDLAERFQSGRLEPAEVLEMHIERIHRLDPGLGAFNDLSIAQARSAARASATRWASSQPASMLDGVPVAVKANIAVAGLPHHAGIAAYRGDIATDDAIVVERLRRAGLVVLGTLNMHEGALGATTDNPAFGRTGNPRLPGHTPGGSSGGSAGAVAAGLVPLALGSDTMGSVRIPSAYCGCAGHKPSPGLIPLDGVRLLSGTLDHVGPHARCVADLISATKLLAGKPEATTCSLDLSEISFGLWDWGSHIDVNADVATGFADAVTKLRRAGARMVSAEPPLYAYGADRRLGLLVSEREAACIHAERLSTSPDGFSEGFRSMMEWGAAQPEAAYQSALERLDTLRLAANELFRRVDFVLAPVAPQSAFGWDAEVPANQADFTAWANFAGLPATAIPTGLSDNGCPLALQVIGPAGLDQETLVAAREIEKIVGRLLPVTPAT
jgi:aspartyl-tRNA(Asn)/glutamyl-tRNA(Gln) amidotransferase subunit A